MKCTINTYIAVEISLSLTLDSAGAANQLRVEEGSSCSSGCRGDWGNSAYPYLQDALVAAVSGDQIWVHKATYYPDEDNGGNVTDDNRTETFTLKNGVKIYGGFDGDETLTCVGGAPSCSGKGIGEACASGTCGDPRDFRCFDGTTYGSTACSAASPCDPGNVCVIQSADETILSGEFQQNGSATDNSYHIVTYDTPNAVVTLDGFTVQAGRADGTGSQQNQGGAVHIRDGQFCIAAGPTLANCIFRDSYASAHGAVNDHGCSTTVDNCAFLDNTADVQGAALNIDNGGTDISDSLFKGNSGGSGLDGDAVWLGERTPSGSCACATTPTFSNCLFDDNDADLGGAVYAVNDSRFTNTTAQHGSTSARKLLQEG